MEELRDPTKLNCKKKKKKNMLREFSNSRHNNIHIIGIPEEGWGAENLFKDKDFHNVGK